MTLSFSSFCLHLPNTGIIGGSHCASLRGTEIKSGLPVRKASILPAGLPLLSLGMLIEINVVNKQHYRRQKSRLAKRLSGEACLSTRTESYIQIPGGGRTATAPKQPPPQTRSVILKTEDHQLRGSPRSLSSPTPTQRCCSWEASGIWKWTAIKASRRREIQIMKG